MIEIEDLKPCPFCGGKAQFLSANFSPLGILHGVECAECDAWLDCRGTNETAAAAAWNRRLALATPDDGWLPIESAPKGHRILVVSNRFPDVHEAMLYDDGWYTWGSGGAYRDDPTHWRPLPAPPANWREG